MKILHIITSLQTGGAEKLMVDLLPRFKAMGHDVELLLFDGTPTPFYHMLVDSGIKILSLGMGENVYHPRHILQLRKIIPHYDIVHTHNTACQYFTAIAKKITQCHCRLVTTEHNTFNRRRQYAIFRLLDRFIYRQYDAIIAISGKTKENLQAFIGHGYPIEVIANGIDLSRFAHDQTQPPPDGTSDVIVTMVAAFRPQKDQDTLLKAIARLPQRYKLWLIGDGERREALTTLTHQLGITDRVRFWGNQTNIPQLMQQSHVIVLSSHWEGFGLSCVEGMAAHRPVIASDVEGLSEVIDHAGILFPTGDISILADKIQQICTDETLYKDIAMSCRCRANDFSIEITAKKYNNIYTKLCPNNQ